MMRKRDTYTSRGDYLILLYDFNWSDDLIQGRIKDA